MLTLIALCFLLSFLTGVRIDSYTFSCVQCFYRYTVVIIDSDLRLIITLVLYYYSCFFVAVVVTICITIIMISIVVAIITVRILS